MKRSTCAFLSLAALAAIPAWPQETAPAAPAPAPSTMWTLGPVKFSGLADAYFSHNLNNPSTNFNAMRNFDVRSDRPSLNFAKLTVEQGPEPVGFRVDIAGGRAMEIFHATEPSGLTMFDYLMQAYVSVRPKAAKGFQLDVGKFVTSAGAEVTETHLNWNYSRSLLYANGPYYHFGARTTVPIGSWTAGFQLVNGWNNLKDNNGAKTVGLTAAYSTPKFLWANNYYMGNEKSNRIDGLRVSAPGLRHFYDTVVGINTGGNISGLFNFDYGIDKTPGGRDNVFYGLSVATRFLGNKRVSFSPRYDWYNDRDGFITTKAQKLQAFTMTADLKLPHGMLTRAEFRRDWSDNPFFDRGSLPGSARSQGTFLVGFMYFFGPKQ